MLHMPVPGIGVRVCQGPGLAFTNVLVHITSQSTTQNIYYNGLYQVQGIIRKINTSIVLNEQNNLKQNTVLCATSPTTNSANFQMNALYSPVL